MSLLFRKPMRWRAIKYSNGETMNSFERRALDNYYYSKGFWNVCCVYRCSKEFMHSIHRFEVSLFAISVKWSFFTFIWMNSTRIVKNNLSTALSSIYLYNTMRYCSQFVTITSRSNVRLFTWNLSLSIDFVCCVMNIACSQHFNVDIKLTLSLEIPILYIPLTLFTFSLEMIAEAF